MSLISEQINALRIYADGRKGELAKLIYDAADMIELLSEKLHASQMERSSQYYHNGWIPVIDCVPNDVEIGEEYPSVIFCTVDGSVYVGFYEYNKYGNRWWNTLEEQYEVKGVIAWMPLPEGYKPEEPA